MRILSVVGARPQFIKASPVSSALVDAGIEEIMVHTGQHYDWDMSQAFFSELRLPEPSFNLGIGSGSHAYQSARMLEGVATILEEEKPDWALVYGDTNSTLAGALAAAQLGIPVAHVEAGLRSHDRTMPEEINRVVTDHVSSLLFAPSALAVANLESEGVRSQILETGDVMIDAVHHVLGTAPRRSEMASRLGMESGGYYAATLHRSATTDDPNRLQRALQLLCAMDLPVILPLHPRTRNALRISGLESDISDSIHIVAPIGYRAMLTLVANARAVLTDSGGLQKEAYCLGTRCITLRSSTEWTDRSVPFGMYWRSSPLVFSLEPLCQGLWGSQK